LSSLLSLSPLPLFPRSLTARSLISSKNTHINMHGYTLTYIHTYPPTRPHTLHTYIHTHLHTHIHTYIHTCRIRSISSLSCIAPISLVCSSIPKGRHRYLQARIPHIL
jgi:molybdopterin-guanine dinucleotide biosynthesis protein A